MKNLKGGYKIVSLQQNDLTANFTLEGLYDAIKDSYNKTILVTEIVISGVHKNDAYTLVNKSGTSYVIEVYGQILTVATNDAVTVATKPQINSIGDGLTLEDGELSATGGGGGGGDLYLHSIVINYRASSVDYVIILNLYMSDGNKSNNFSALIDKIYENYVISEQTGIMCGGYTINGMAYTIELPTTKPDSSTDLRVYTVNSFSQTSFGSTYFKPSQVNAYNEVVCKVI